MQGNEGEGNSICKMQNQERYTKRDPGVYGVESVEIVEIVFIYEISSI